VNQKELIIEIIIFSIYDNIRFIDLNIDCVLGTDVKLPNPFTGIGRAQHINTIE